MLAFSHRFADLLVEPVAGLRMAVQKVHRGSQNPVRPSMFAARRSASLEPRCVRPQDWRGWEHSDRAAGCRFRLGQTPLTRIRLRQNRSLCGLGMGGSASIAMELN